MPDTTPAEELRAAAAQLRPSSPAVATHTVAVRIPTHAANALADWLEALADWAREYPEMAHDHDRPACEDYACDVMGRGIALARAINGQQPRETGQEGAGGPHRASDGSTGADRSPQSLTEVHRRSVAARPPHGRHPPLNTGD